MKKQSICMPVMKGLLYAWIGLAGALCVGVVHAQEANLILSEDFENGFLGPRMTLQTDGAFSTDTGVKDTTQLAGMNAFGFGRSTDDPRNSTSLIIALPEPRFISHLSFKEMELFGNAGSIGEVFIDGEKLPQAFGGVVDGIADTTFREPVFTVNDFGGIIELRVIGISPGSEIFVDDIHIFGEGGRISNERTIALIFDENFESGTLNSNETLETAGEFSSSAGIDDRPELGGMNAFGFGRSTGDPRNSTSLFIALPEPRFISHLSFKEMELFGNAGSVGAVFIDGEPLPQGFGGVVDGVPDVAFRERTFTVNRSAENVELRVTGISPGSEIFVDDIQIFETILVPQTFFADFTITKVSADLNDAPNTDKVKIKGTFDIGQDSDGVDLANEGVTVTIGSSSFTVPGDFLEEDDDKFTFKGPLGESTVKVKVNLTEQNIFKFTVKISSFDLTGFSNPLNIMLRVGDDVGEASIPLQGQLLKALTRGAANSVFLGSHQYRYDSLQ